ncbi:MAG: hypothetical protein AAF710_04860 [Planctomycetota bacterium]
MKVRHPGWFRAAIATNLLAFGCFLYSTTLPADRASKAIVFGIGCGVAALYMFAVACKPERNRKKKS